MDYGSYNHAQGSTAYRVCLPVRQLSIHLFLAGKSNSSLCLSGLIYFDDPRPIFTSRFILLPGRWLIPRSIHLAIIWDCIFLLSFDLPACF